MSDKGLISKMHKNSYTSIAKINSPILKTAKDLNRHFSKRKKDIQLASAYIYENVLSITIRECKSKPQCDTSDLLDDYYQKKRITNVSKDVKTTEGGNVNWYSHCEKQYVHQQMNG